MGEDGLAPKALGAVHPRYRTPALAILVMAGWGSSLVLLGALLTRHELPVIALGGFELNLNVPKGKALFDILTDFAMFGAVSFETLAVASIFMLRWRYPDAERPYRCWGYPIVPIAYVLIMAAVLANMFRTQTTEALSGAGFIALGALVYPVVESINRRGVASPK
jgi:amino acid transporter